MLKKILLISVLFYGLLPLSFGSTQIYYPNSNKYVQQNLYQPSQIIETKRAKRINRFNNHNFQNQYRGLLSAKDLYALEKYALGKTYKREPDLRRLERLENLAFGATQYGDLATRYNNVESVILSRPKYGTKTGLMKNLASYFLGQTTGYTPSLVSSPDYNSFGEYSQAPGFNTQRYDQYSNGIFGGGWGVYNNNFTNGSSIRMLD